MPQRRRPRRAGALLDLPPLKIIKQITLLQLAFYTCGTVLILFTALVAGKPFTADLVLSWRSLRGDTTVGWTLGLCWMLNSLLSVIFLLLLVSRSKLILDFALTIHFLHLTITSLYTRAIPTNLLWWALQAASATLMTTLGIWSCQWRELQPIHFGGNPGNTPRPSTSNETADLEDGFAIGRGRGRGKQRDGGGEYEMVGMKDNISNNG